MVQASGRMCCWNSGHYSALEDGEIFGANKRAIPLYTEGYVWAFLVARPTSQPHSYTSSSFGNTESSPCILLAMDVALQLDVVAVLEPYVDAALHLDVATALELHLAAVLELDEAPCGGVDGV